MAPCQLCCPTTGNNVQNAPRKAVQSSVLRLNSLQHTSSCHAHYSLPSKKQAESNSFQGQIRISNKPEELTLGDGLLQTEDDEHLICPLLPPPWEEQTSNKQGWMGYGDLKNAIAWTSCSIYPIKNSVSKKIEHSLPINTGFLLLRVLTTQVQVLGFRGKCDTLFII